MVFKRVDQSDVEILGLQRDWEDCFLLRPELNSWLYTLCMFSVEVMFSMLIQETNLCNTPHYNLVALWPNASGQNSGLNISSQGGNHQSMRGETEYLWHLLGQVTLRTSQNQSFKCCQHTTWQVLIGESSNWIASSPVIIWKEIHCDRSIEDDIQRDIIWGGEDQETIDNRSWQIVGIAIEFCRENSFNVDLYKQKQHSLCLFWWCDLEFYHNCVHHIAIIELFSWSHHAKISLQSFLTLEQPTF